VVHSEQMKFKQNLGGHIFVVLCDIDAKCEIVK